MDCFWKLELWSLFGWRQNTLFGQNINSSSAHPQFLAGTCKSDTNPKLPCIEYGSIDSHYHYTMHIDLPKHSNSFSWNSWYGTQFKIRILHLPNKTTYNWSSVIIHNFIVYISTCDWLLFKICLKMFYGWPRFVWLHSNYPYVSNSNIYGTNWPNSY